MSRDETSSSSDADSRVIKFRRDKPLPRQPAPVEDIEKYQGEPETPADYRHRMIVNAIAFAFIIAFIGAGLWLADTMANMRKDQDCVLSGRRGCSPVEVQGSRW